MESLGFTVLRFENRFVFQEPEYLKNEIRKVINKKENRSDKPINHPGRNQPLQYFDYHCTAATPPSKGGESLLNCCFTIRAIYFPKISNSRFTTVPFFI